MPADIKFIFPTDFWKRRDVTWSRPYISLLIIFLLWVPGSLLAQELNCQVQILTQQIEGTDKKVFETMRDAIFEFMNNRKWTNDIYKNEERIECTFTIAMKNRLSIDEFDGSIQVQLRRPVFNSGYNSLLLNFNDNNLRFRYVEYQPLEFTDNQHISNLTSILAYYAYMVIGFDYDSYSLNGGTPFFVKAKAIVDNAQNAPESGWKRFENDRNRYWLVEDMLDQRYSPLRECSYKYHRTGLDRMHENVEIARGVITESLELLEKIHKEKPMSFLLQVFFDSKSDEVVNIYSSAYPNEKARIVPLLNKINAANSVKYQKIMK